MLRPCGTFTPANRCKISPALTIWTRCMEALLFWLRNAHAQRRETEDGSAICDITTFCPMRLRLKPTNRYSKLSGSGGYVIC